MSRELFKDISPFNYLNSIRSKSPSHLDFLKLDTVDIRKSKNTFLETIRSIENHDENHSIIQNEISDIKRKEIFLNKEKDKYRPFKFITSQNSIPNVVSEDSSFDSKRDDICDINILNIKRYESNLILGRPRQSLMREILINDEKIEGHKTSRKFLQHNFKISMNSLKKSITSEESVNDDVIIECSCLDILIVDDENYNISSIKYILKSSNLYADSASNGQDCLDKILSNNSKSCCKIEFRLIFMDIFMPVMGGIETCQKIQEFVNKKQINVPPKIIIVSGHDGDDIKSRINIIEIVKEFVPKPINKGKVEEILNKYYF